MHEKTKNIIEDLEWLLDCGETHPETIARRLGCNLRNLYRLLYRAGRPDLARQITPKATSQPLSTLNTMGPNTAAATTPCQPPQETA